MNALETAAAVRSSAGVFRHADRGLIAVRGGDRVRWLDGMLSNDIRALGSGERSGCYALLLTRQGRIVADFHVLARPDALWLETAAAAVAPALETLGKFIIADDVALEDASTSTGRIGVEGPGAPALAARVFGAPLELAADACREVEIAGTPALVAAFGWSGEPGFQLLLPHTGVASALAALHAAEPALLEADAASLEILRIEAGIPRFGRELDDSVLPAEARLERAVSTAKGCYTGQEVVARMASRGRVGHRLVGLRFAADAPPAAGAELHADARKVGELTSSCVSPRCGAVALGYVRSASAADGSELRAGDLSATITPLPFLPGLSAGSGLHSNQPAPPAQADA